MIELADEMLARVSVVVAMCCESLISNRKLGSWSAPVVYEVAAKEALCSRNVKFPQRST